MTGAHLDRYSLMRRQFFPADALGDTAARGWDLLVQVWDGSERVSELGRRVHCGSQVIFALPEYGITSLPEGVLPLPEGDEAEVVRALIGHKQLADALDRGDSIVFDITGLLRPHIIFLLRFLRDSVGLKQVDLLYAEPTRYAKDENTVFTRGAVRHVRPIRTFGMSGRFGEKDQHYDEADCGSEALLIAGGYEQELVSHVCSEKSGSARFLLLGFPSLQPDFYVHSRLRLARLDVEVVRQVFAPANDPFVTASVVADFSRKQMQAGAKAIALAPLSTKAQALGFGLAYLVEGLDKAGVSILYPFSERSAPSSSTGLNGAWWYQASFDC